MKMRIDTCSIPNFTHHHITNLDLAKLKLGQQDQAIRLSNALGKPPVMSSKRVAKDSYND
jgi:hypothetical protein